MLGSSLVVQFAVLVLTGVSWHVCPGRSWAPANGFFEQSKGPAADHRAPRAPHDRSRTWKFGGTASIFRAIVLRGTVLQSISSVTKECHPFQRVANDSGTRETEPLLADGQPASNTEQHAPIVADSNAASPARAPKSPRGATVTAEPEGGGASGWQGRAAPPGWTPVKTQDEATVQQAHAGHPDGTSIQ